MLRRGTGVRLLRSVTVLILLFIYIPITLVVVYAFNASGTSAWPPSGFTLHWIDEAMANTGLQQAFLTSLGCALAATLLALILGTLASLAVARYRFFGRDSISFAVILPIALPGVVTGMALSTTFGALGVTLGLATVVVGHATFCVVLVYNNAIARLRRTARSLEEASADLGADTFQTFRHVTFPALRSALLAGGLLAFALSFDEVIVTTFTAGAQNTLPLWIFGQIRLGQRLPQVNVVVLFVIAITIIPVFLAQRLTRDTGVLRRTTGRA